jgi:hypothetical protein
MASLIETAITGGTTGAALDAVAVAQYNASLRYWESFAKAADLCEAIGYILGNFTRTSSAAGKSWTREDLAKQLDRAEAARETMQPISMGTNAARTVFTKGRAL